MKTVIKTLLLTILIIVVSSWNVNNKNTELDTRNLGDSHKTKQFIKVALLLDTSNSMDGLIDQAKAQLWEIVNELSYAKCDDSKPNLEIALYEYGNDKLNGDEGFIRQVLAFSQDLDEISKELFSLTTDGGNEYCGHVIQTSIKQLKWGNNPDDLKLIFIAGNEPFTQGAINYKKASLNAHEKNISVNTIFCGDYNQGISSYWKDGADLAHGDYMAINHNHATVHIASPYDDKILNLNQKLNKTYVAYGSYGHQKMALQVEQDSNAKGYSDANAVSRTISKSSHLYKNSTWDLVDAEVSEGFSYDKLKESDLPSDLKGKTKDELRTYIANKRKERKHIQEEIKVLNLKRKSYLLKQQKDHTNALENAMINSIKKQSATKKL